MIKDALIPILKRRYSGQGLRIGNPPGPIAVFPAKHPAVGDLEIYDGGGEATIYIRGITHGHFNPYDDELSQEEIDRQVTDAVLEFLEDMFADRVLLWKAGRSDGWRRLDYTEGTVTINKDGKCCVWSGPYKPQASG